MPRSEKGRVYQTVPVLCAPNFVLCCSKKLATCHVFTVASEGRWHLSSSSRPDVWSHLCMKNWHPGPEFLRQRPWSCGQPSFLGRNPILNPPALPRPPPKKSNNKKAVICLGGFSVRWHLLVYLHQKINANVLILAPQACSSCHDFVILGGGRKSSKVIAVAVDGPGAPASLFFLIVVSWELLGVFPASPLLEFLAIAPLSRPPVLHSSWRGPTVTCTWQERMSWHVESTHTKPHAPCKADMVLISAFVVLLSLPFPWEWIFISQPTSGSVHGLWFPVAIAACALGCLETRGTRAPGLRASEEREPRDGVPEACWDWRSGWSPAPWQVAAGPLSPSWILCCHTLPTWASSLFLC